MALVYRGHGPPRFTQYLVDELREKLALPRFRLTPATQAAIVADYLSFAEFITEVPQSGIQSRDPRDTPVLDLALAADVDALVAGDGDLLDLDGEFKFPIVRTSGLQQMLQLGTAQQNNPNPDTLPRPKEPPSLIGTEQCPFKPSAGGLTIPRDSQAA